MSTATAETEVTERSLVEAPQVVSAGVLAQITSSEIDRQIATARAFPRSVERFRKECLSLATLDEEVAKTMFYAVPRSGKMVEGPSVRLAELAAYCWGNLRHGSRLVDISDRFAVGQGFAFDMERNTGTQIEVNRRITDKSGKTYGDDMIAVTSAAACSIALRQAIFKVIPRALIDPIWLAARQVAIGDAKSYKNKLAGWADHFAKMGISKDQLAKACQKQTFEDLTGNDLAMLIGLANAIKDGEKTLDEAFGDLEPRTTTKRLARSSPLNEPAEPAEAPAEPQEVKPDPDAHAKAFAALCREWLVANDCGATSFDKLKPSEKESARKSFCDWAAGYELPKSAKSADWSAEEIEKAVNALGAEAVR